MSKRVEVVIMTPPRVDVNIQPSRRVELDIPRYVVASIIPSNYGLITWDGSVLTVS